MIMFPILQKAYCLDYCSQQTLPVPMLILQSPLTISCSQTLLSIITSQNQPKQKQKNRSTNSVPLHPHSTLMNNTKTNKKKNNKKKDKQKERQTKRKTNKKKDKKKHT